VLTNSFVNNLMCVSVVTKLRFLKQKQVHPNKRRGR